MYFILFKVIQAHGKQIYAHISICTCFSQREPPRGQHFPTLTSNSSTAKPTDGYLPQQRYRQKPWICPVSLTAVDIKCFM